MVKRNKLWLSMQAVTLAGATALAACSMEGEEGKPEGDVGKNTTSSTTETTAPLYNQGEGGEGEGEGVKADTNPATNDLAYLTQLGLMRGHLLVGYQLYQQGELEHAKTHMKHPKSELYAAVVPAFETRGAEGFADQLSKLSESVNNDAGNDSVSEHYAALTEAISASEQVVPDANNTPAAKLKLAVELLRVAGEEYAIGIADGKLQNAHEYQDAYGFTQIAKATVNDIQTEDKTTLAAVEKAKAQITGLDSLWPSIVPPQEVAGDASAIYGAAARVEILALGL